MRPTVLVVAAGVVFGVIGAITLANLPEVEEPGPEAMSETETEPVDTESPHLPTTTSPTPSDTPSTPAPVPSFDEALRGYGQTREHWMATHTSAEGYVPEAAFEPLLSDGQPSYGTVFGDERILGYTLYLEGWSTMNDAEIRVRLELPADAVPGPVVTIDECRLQKWTSETLERTFEGDFGSAVLVNYNPTGSFGGSPYFSIDFLAMSLDETVEEQLC